MLVVTGGYRDGDFVLYESRHSRGVYIAQEDGARCGIKEIRQRNI